MNLKLTTIILSLLIILSLSASAELVKKPITTIKVADMAKYSYIKENGHFYFANTMDELRSHFDYNKQRYAIFYVAPPQGGAYYLIGACEKNNCFAKSENYFINGKNDFTDISSLQKNTGQIQAGDGICFNLQANPKTITVHDCKLIGETEIKEHIPGDFITEFQLNKMTKFNYVHNKNPHHKFSADLNEYTGHFKHLSYKQENYVLFYANIYNSAPQEFEQYLIGWCQDSLCESKSFKYYYKNTNPYTPKSKLKKDSNKICAVDDTCFYIYPFQDAISVYGAKEKPTESKQLDQGGFQCGHSDWKQGKTYTLSSDIKLDDEINSFCLSPTVSHVSIDCNGHKIINKKKVNGQRGVSIKDVYDITVSNCIIENFDIGIAIQDSDSNKLINNKAVNNKYYDFFCKETAVNKSKNNFGNKNEFKKVQPCKSNNWPSASNVSEMVETTSYTQKSGLIKKNFGKNPSQFKGTELSGFVKTLFGNQKINIHITQENKKTIILGLITENGKVKEFSEKQLTNPTINLYGTEKTLNKIQSSKKPLAALKTALDTKEITYKTTGIGNKVKFSIVKLFITIGSGFT